MEEEKLRQFVNDQKMCETVYELLFNSFLNKPSKDIYILGASRLSLDFLKDAWKELEKYKVDREGEEEKNPTPHV